MDTHQIVARPALQRLLVFLLAAFLVTVGGTPRTVEGAGNCDPNPQYVDCLTSPIGVTGTVQGTTITLHWSYDPAVYTDSGRPISLTIYNVGGFGLKKDAVYSELWNTAQPLTSHPVPGLSPGEHGYYVCLDYHTLVVYTSGESFDSYPEECPPLPSGGTVGGTGGSSHGTPLPASPPAPQPPAAASKPLPQPVLRAEAAGAGSPNYGLVHLTWDNPIDPIQRTLLTDMDWYRDDHSIYRGSDTTERDDGVRPNSGPYRYKLCIENAVDYQCSEEVNASPTPVPPTAPSDVHVARLDLAGGTSDNGILLQPRHIVSITWFNTSITGKFTTVERQDVQATPNADPNSPSQFVGGSFWNELTRLSVAPTPAPLPTSAEVDAAQGADPSTLTLQQGTTYRVCAVVPSLGDAGRACSSPASLDPSLPTPAQVPAPTGPVCQFTVQGC